jgi:predicted transcriptional regulator of viral defense system
MQHLTEIAFEKTSGGVFTRAEVACWVGGSAHRQFNLIKRAFGSGEVVHVRRGLYCLAPKYRREKIDPLVLAQRIYGPSYISLESALAYHGWIPEAVYTITSAAVDRSREFATPLGQFSFARVPQNVFYAQVARVKKEGGESFLVASPLKALADYVYVHRQDWRSVDPVVESLRVEESAVRSVDGGAIDELLANYPALRVRRFLKGWRKGVTP